MSIAKKILAIIKTRKYLFIVLVVILSVVIYAVSRPDKSNTKTAPVLKGDILQEVSVTGRVKSADAVELAFERGGRISGAIVKEGEKITAGQVLLQLESQELLAQRLNAQANVLSAQARLDQLIAGARAEDVQIAQTTYDSALRNLNETIARDAMDTARSSLNVAVNAMVTLTDLQVKYFNTTYAEAIAITEKKAAAMEAIYGLKGLGQSGSSYFLNLNVGLKQEIAGVSLSPNATQVEALLAKIKNALTLVSVALDVEYGSLSGTVATDAEKVTLNTARTAILSQLSILTAQEQKIIVAENTLKDAQARLDLKKAPPTQYDIDIAKAGLSQAEASWSLIDAQLNKQTLRSPISGVVTKIVPKRGEIVSPNIPVVSVVSSAKYQIEANVPEADIVKLKVGQNAKVTADAFGADTIFSTHIISINPGGVITDGVATYKVTFEFDVEDPRILSGLTVDMKVMTDSRQGVLYVPSRNITNRNGTRFVVVATKNEGGGYDVADKEISIGLKGSDGRTEILSGLQEGELIVTN